MDAYWLADDVFSDPDLLTAGDRLIAFSEAAMLEKNRQRPLNYLYKNACTYSDIIARSRSFSSMPLGGRFGLFDGELACRLLLSQLLLSVRSTPVKTLKAISALGAELKKTYREPSGEALDMREVSDILEYLDITFSIRDAVLADAYAALLLLPYGHSENNGRCLVLHDRPTGRVAVKVLLFDNGWVKSDPRYVLCHELGHALHTMYDGNAEVAVPEEILCYLEIFAPSIRTLERGIQNEILADLLAVGLMYGSPFADADPFVDVPGEGKEFLYRLVRLMCQKTIEGERIVPTVQDC